MLYKLFATLIFVGCQTIARVVGLTVLVLVTIVHILNALFINWEMFNSTFEYKVDYVNEILFFTPLIVSMRMSSTRHPFNPQR